MLEIGSATGEFAAEFCARYPQTTFLGLELSQIGVEIASRRAPFAEFRQRDLLLPAQRQTSPNFEPRTPCARRFSNISMNPFSSFVFYLFFVVKAFFVE